MKRNALRILALLLCIILPLSACAQSETETTQEQTEPNAVEIFKEYTALDLTPYLGKTILLNFFTEWCGYCMMEMPDFRELHDLYSPEQFQMVMIHVWSGEDETNTQNVKDRFDMHDMTFFEDTDTMVAAVAGVPGFPTTFILHPDGTVAFAQGSMMTLEMLTTILDGLGVERAVKE